MAGTHDVTLAPRIFLAEYDISGDMNAHSIQHSVELPEDSSYGDTFKQRKIGLRDTSFSIAGFVDQSGATDTDTLLTSKLGVADVPLIMAHIDASVGSVCDFALIDEATYQPEAAHGQVFKYGVTGNLSSRKWIRGQVLWAPDTAISGTSNGAEVEVGAVSATQKLYVAIAVWAANLTSMVVKVQSDTTGFPSSTDRVTFTTVTTTTSEMPTPVSGAITDTFWRAAVTSFSGTSAKMIVVAGIA